MAKTGRPAIFRPKRKGRLIQGMLTDRGQSEFEAARKRLAKLADLYRVEGRRWKAADVSDADAIDYLARGHVATVHHLAGLSTR